MRKGHAERGFTLIELMIVVAIIAILAVIVVPMWTRETRKGKGSAEVNGMFTELTTKLEAYKLEVGTYLDVAECPTAPVVAGGNFSTTCITSGSNWEKLRVQPTSSKIHCTYQVESGIASDVLTPPSSFKNSQGTAATAEPTLAGSWWYLLAECDQDGQGGTNTTYYKSSVDGKLQVLNEGK